MKEEIIFLVSILFFIGFISAVQEPFIYYKLNLDYSYGNLSINSTEIEFSNRHIENNFGFYSAMVLDFDGNILNLTFFDVPNVIFYDATDPETGKITGGGLMEFNETQSEIYVPYYKNAKEMVIYDQNTNELIRKSVREFLTEEVKKYDYNDLINLIAHNTLQRALREKIKSIYVLSSCEFRIVKKV